MNNEEKNKTQEAAEQDFYDNLAKIFMEKVPDAYVDEESGFLIVPRRRKKSNTEK